MQVIDILRINRSFLELQTRCGIKSDDVKYISLYNEYQSMTEAGYKVTYATEVLAKKHGITQRAVYDILKRLKKTVK